MTSVEGRKASIGKSRDSNAAAVPPPAAALARRRSTIRSFTKSVPLLMGLRRMSRVSSNSGITQNNKPKLENTYRLEPEDDGRFNTGKARDIIHSTLEAKLGGTTYDAVHCKELTRSLANLIRNRVKDLDYTRYKIICNVIVGSCEDQALQMASRCLWNDTLDTSASATFKNESIFAVGTVHAVYFE